MLMRHLSLILAMWLFCPILRATAQQENFFTGSPPTFKGEESPYKEVYIPNTHYYFKFSLSEKANTPIAQILIQPQPNIEEIALVLSETKAFLGTPNNRGSQIEIATVTQDPNSRLITVSFTEAIKPGTDFTVALQTKQNPSYQGIYQYTVYAVPIGTSPVPMDLGVARFHFYSWGR